MTQDYTFNWFIMAFLGVKFIVFGLEVQWPLEVIIGQIQFGNRQIWIQHVQYDKIILVANFGLNMTQDYTFNLFIMAILEVQWPLEVIRRQIQFGNWQIWIQHAQYNKIILVGNFGLNMTQDCTFNWFIMAIIGVKFIVFGLEVLWPLEVIRRQIRFGNRQIWIQHPQINKVRLVANFVSKMPVGL